MCANAHGSNPIGEMLTSLLTDMQHVQAPGPTAMQRWRGRLAQISEAVGMVLGRGNSANMEMSSGVSHRTNQGFVHLVWGESRGQLAPNEARAHALRLLEAAEAADYDSIFLQWLMEHHLVEDVEHALHLLVAFRHYREERATASTTHDQAVAEDPP